MEKLREMEVARQEMKRKAFESHCLSTDFVFSLAFWEGKYSHPATQMAWEMWQAGQTDALKDHQNWQFMQVWNESGFIAVYANIGKCMCIKDDNHLLVHGCDAYSVHHIHKPNGWQIAGYIESFASINEAKRFIEAANQ